LTNGFEQFGVGQDMALEAALAELRVALDETVERENPAGAPVKPSG
jgi:hypothetical protein